MSKRQNKFIPQIICCKETIIMDNTERKRVTPTVNRKQNKRMKREEETTSVNTGGVEDTGLDFSIETGMDLGLTEQVQLLEQRIESLENEKKLMIKDVAILTKKIVDCQEEQSHAWECRNKFIGLHNEKLATYITKLQAYTCEKLHGIHTAIAEKHMNIINKLETTEKALRGCWFVTDNKVDLLWQKEEERKEAEETSGMEGRR
jgi:hypothetical protein